MVIARPVLVRVLPGKDLAPAGAPMIWTGPIRGNRAMAPGRIRAPWRSPVAPTSIKPRGPGPIMGQNRERLQTRGK
jgi:hypothetical protein